VAVEPGSLGGDPRSVCEPDGGGRSAARLFEDGGWALTRVSSQPSFVCRLGGRPASASCAQVPPADAYWSLWWSDGHSGWVYSSLGVDSLTVPDGGAVAFTWVDGSDDGTPTLPAPGDGPSDGPSVRATPEAQPRTDATSSADSHADSHADSGGELPGWVAPVVVVVLAGAAGGTALARRRR
jgi:hypothetical protein